MQTIVRYNFKLRPGKQVSAKLWGEWCKCRFVWNNLVDAGKENYRAFKDGGKPDSLTFSRMSKDLTRLRAENEWLRTGSCVVQQQTVRKWAASYWRAVKAKSGRPCFKSAKRDCPTLEYTRNGFTIKGERLVLAGKLSIPVVWSRGLPSTPTSCVVFRDKVGDWFVSFVVRVEDTPLPKNENGVGIDWGVSATATCSDGTSLEASRRTKLNAVRLCKAQRSVSRAKRGSRKRKARALRVSRLQRSVARQRKDAAYKWAGNIVSRFHYLAVEDFNPKFLAKTTMAKQAADNAVGLTKHILISKAERAGRVVALIPPAYTTMTCSGCGARAKHRLPLAQRVFKCTECGFTASRDVNAARTILAGAGFNPAAVEEVRHAVTFGSGMLSEAGIPSV